MYRYQTRNYSSHNPVDNGILFHLSVAYRHVNRSIHDKKIVDSRGDDEKFGIMYQETSHYYFQNNGESVDSYGISGNRYQNIPYTSHKPGVIGILLGFYVHGCERSGHRYHTIKLSSHNHGGLYIVHPR